MQLTHELGDFAKIHFAPIPAAPTPSASDRDGAHVKAFERLRSLNFPFPLPDNPTECGNGNTGQRAEALRVTAMGCSVGAAAGPWTDTKPVS